MTRTLLVRTVLPVVCALGVLLARDTVAQVLPSPDSGAAVAGSTGADRMSRLGSRLERLKERLQLDPGQVPAWSVWHDSLLADAQAWSQSRAAWRASLSAPPPSGLTAPQRLQGRTDRLRQRIAMLQEHLARLEAATARTQTFYAQLGPKQQSVFDGFWQGLQERRHARGQRRGAP